MLLGEGRRVRVCVGKCFLNSGLQFCREKKLRASFSARAQAAAWHLGKDFLELGFRFRNFSSGAKGESRASLTDTFDRFQSTHVVMRRRKRSSADALEGARRRPVQSASTPPRARGRSSLRVRSSRSVPSRGACASRAAYVFTGRISFRRATRRARSRLTPPSPQSFSASRPLQQPCPSWRPSRCRAPRSSPPRHPSAGAAPRAARAW